MQTAVVRRKKYQVTLGEMAEAFRTEAEALCEDVKEAEILATTALLNFLTRNLPKASSLRDVMARLSAASSLAKAS